MATALEAYREDFSRYAGKAVFLDKQTSGLAFGSFTKDFAITPAIRPMALAAKVLMNYSITVAATAVAGTDALSPLLDGEVYVSPSAQSAPRSQMTGGHKSGEDIEQTLFDTQYGYPRGALPTAVGTYTASWYCGIGGQAASLKIRLPAQASVWSAGTIVINSITVYLVEGVYDGVVAFWEMNTPSLGTGLQPMGGYIGGNVAPDVVIFEGDSVSNISQVQIVAQDNKVAMNIVDPSVLTDGALALTPRTGALGSGSVSFAFLGIIPRVFNVGFVAAGVHDSLALQVSGSGNIVPSTPQTTVGVPAVTQTGVPNVANIPVAKGAFMRSPLHA